MYIDNGLREKIFMDSELYEKFCNEIDGNSQLPDIKGYKRRMTHFSILEAIGLTIKINDIPGIPSYIDKIIEAMGTNGQKEDPEKIVEIGGDYMVSLLSEYEDKVSKDENFTKKNIKNLVDKKLSRVPPQTRSIYKEILDIDDMGRFLEEVCTMVAFEKIQEHRHSEEIKKYMHTLFFSEMTHFFRDNKKNFSFARSMYNWMEFAIKKNDERNLEKIKRFRYKTSKDLMDTELIHLAVAGFYSGKRKPVHCYTCDDGDITHKRILFYITSINFMFQESKEIQKSLPRDIIVPGKVVVCKSTGEISNIIDVEKEHKECDMDIFQFIAKEEESTLT